MKRTNTCGEITKEDVGKTVSLCGWVSTRRDHGGVLFIDLRDRYGFTQVVFNPDSNNAFETADKLRREDVVSVTGEVKLREQDTVNKNITTGEVELVASEILVINKSMTPPIEIDDRVEANEDVRLKYRFLDLRRPIVQQRLMFRHKVVTAGREFFNNNDFLEIDTPMLVKSTPEGARDYVVPSRVNPGEFYALPQSPQLYKQLLMISGFDRYYQLARCLRDEDLRADRQPEHTQFDFEMSFMDADQIRAMVEGLLSHIFKKTKNIDIETPFVKLTYKEAMDKYGTDKPDLRYDLQLTDVTDIVEKSDFGVFKSMKSNGGIVKVVNPKGEFGRNEIDNYIKFCQEIGSKGMAWMRVTEDGLDSNIVKYFPKEVQDALIEATGAEVGSVLMFIADKPKKCNTIISKLRIKLAEDMNLIKPDDFKFCWTYDFPLFSYNETESKWEPEHHMFSMPKEEFVNDFEQRPGEVLGDLWDLVLNGMEMASGSIRVTNPTIQKRIMKFVGIDEEKANEKFGFLLNAYNYGGPVHGGMGIGVDRLVAMMQGLTDIREVIPFPKNKNAESPMDQCPSELDDVQLKELHIKKDIIKAEKKK